MKMNRFGNKLAEDVLVDGYFKELNEKIILLYSNSLFGQGNNIELTNKEFSDILRFIDILSNSTESIARNKAYSIISLLYDSYKDDERYLRVAYAVFIKLGLFASSDLLKDKAELPFDRELEKNIKLESHITPDGKKLFTDSQYDLFTKMFSANCFSFSGPTSMGKSFLIQKFIEKQIIDKKVKILVVIVPSRALITQFSQELHAEFGDLLKDNNFKIYTNSNVVKSINVEAEENNIFVLTPERLHSYLSQNGSPSIDILFVDEAHKLTSNDDRAITEYSAIDIALKKFPKMRVFFASPNIANPETFLKLFHLSESNSYSTIETPVSQNFYLIDTSKSSVKYNEGGNYIELSKINKKYCSDILNSIYKIGESRDSNLIYCNSPRLVVDNAKEFYDILEDVEQCDEIKRARRIIKDYIHDEYYLRKFLKKGVAYHHGKLPQAVRNIVEDLFRKRKIKFLFSTSTLLEGVNMPIRNIFIIPGKERFKTAKDANNINNSSKSINFWNLAGRAGRFMKEFSGNVFCYINSENTVSLDILKKEQTKATPIVLTRVQKNLKAIEEVLKNGIKDTKKEQKILEYIANIITIDTMRFDNYNESFLLREFVKLNHDKIIELAKKNADKVKDVPLSVLTSYKSLSLKIQREIYYKIKDNPTQFKLPQVGYDNILSQLENFQEWYEWKINEKGFCSSNGNPNARLKYWAFLMNKWISDTPLNLIINERLERKHERGEDIWLTRDPKSSVLFDIDNPLHINIEINSLLEDIESSLRFKLERYFNHYHQLLVHFLGEEKAGINWATYLEYGTRHSIVIGLQNIGLSRHTANTIFKHFKKHLIIENDLLSGYNKGQLLKDMKRDKKKYYVEIDEVSKLA